MMYTRNRVSKVRIHEVIPRRVQQEELAEVEVAETRNLYVLRN